VVERWHAAATEVVRLLDNDPRLKRQLLHRADEILREIQADDFAAYAATKPDPEARGAARAINEALREARMASRAMLRPNQKHNALSPQIADTKLGGKEHGCGEGNFGCVGAGRCISLRVQCRIGIINQSVVIETLETWLWIATHEPYGCQPFGSWVASPKRQLSFASLPISCLTHVKDLVPTLAVLRHAGEVMIARCRYSVYTRPLLSPASASTTSFQ
jgi:hypothetical protein